jgi:hypothetical protein
VLDELQLEALEKARADKEPVTGKFDSNCRDNAVPRIPLTSKPSKGWFGIGVSGRSYDR